ncbi:MAG TPA: DUF1659 domain-containing protein [Clostridia bacterium]|nr:DUF1659 domain-containing protein [Clostridia bacterium]
MPVIATPLYSSLRLVVQVGVDGEGNPVNRFRTYQRVKPEATDQEVFEVAQNLAGLQDYPLNGVQRILTSDLLES